MSHIITFYSYKGGTGRSMALANVAWILASAGKRVLTIDWDLEAPGLHRYFQPVLTDKELRGQESQGIIDMVMDFAVQAATPVKEGDQRDDTWYKTRADFSKWRQKLRWPSGEPIRLGAEGRGEIDFVPAGRQSAEYATRVNRFDWHNFYEKLGGGIFFDTAKRNLDVYDYVLIDSRTGVSDTSGICTVHMPDTLVVCFTLNYQSIKGALAVAESVREQRPQMRVFPLPTRIDGSEEKSLNRMKNYAANAFSAFLDSKVDLREYWYSMEVPYFARYAYAEKLSLFEEQASISTSTLPAMERLSGYLTDGDIRTAEPLPEDERIAALEEFDGVASSQASSAAISERSTEKPPALRVFISSRPEDRALALAVRDSLTRLGAAISNMIETFLDFIDINPGEAFTDVLARELSTAEFFLVVNTDRPGSTSGDSTLFEVGFFNALIQDDVRRNSRTIRRILDIFVTKSSSVTVSQVSNGIDVSIPVTELRRSGLDYLRSLERSLVEEDSLFRLYNEIALQAQNRLPPRAKKELEKAEIGQALIPLRMAIFDSMKTRIAGEIVFNGVVDLELPDSASDGRVIPNDTKVKINQVAQALLTVTNDEITWEKFKDVFGVEASLVDAIEQIVAAVGLRLSPVETERVVRTSGDRTLRVVLTRQIEFFDGRKNIRLALIEAPRINWSGDRAISVGFLSLASRYKDIFDRNYGISVHLFNMTRDFEGFKRVTRDLVSRLHVIESNANDLELNDPKALVGLFRESLPDGARLNVFIDLAGSWGQANTELMTSAREILDWSAKPSEFDSLRIRFISAFEHFQEITDRLSSLVASQALENLSKTFRDQLPFQLFP